LNGAWAQVRCYRSFFAVSAPDGRCVVTIRPRESAVVHGGDLLLLDDKPGRSSGSERICNHAIRISSARHGALASDVVISCVIFTDLAAGNWDRLKLSSCADCRVRF
jgi:hypothetical protein